MKEEEKKKEYIVSKNEEKGKDNKKSEGRVTEPDARNHARNLVSHQKPYGRVAQKPQPQIKKRKLKLLKSLGKQGDIRNYLTSGIERERDRSTHTHTGELDRPETGLYKSDDLYCWSVWGSICISSSLSTSSKSRSRLPRVADKDKEIVDTGRRSADSVCNIHERAVSKKFTTLNKLIYFTFLHLQMFR